MRIHSVELVDFRNIATAQVTLSPHFTALVGPNGQGKTNTLEALYLTAALRPLRPVPRRALVREGQSVARVSMRVFREGTGLTHALRVELEPSRRRLLRDDKATAAASFIGTLVAVAFTPDDLNLAKGAPEARRKFLDRAILNVRPAFLSRALRYQKAVRDRNRLLVEAGNDAQLEAFDEVLSREGAAITELRCRYIEQLTPRVETFFRRIADPAPPLTLTYESRLLAEGPAATEAELADRFAERLKNRRPIDRARKTTSVGPHLDDLRVSLDGASARDRASQGQHRAIVLALKLAEITHLAEALGEPPVLLLDDMSSELDRIRSAQLFSTVRDLEGQVVLTSTQNPDQLAGTLGGELVVYDVDAGTLKQRASRLG